MSHLEAYCLDVVRCWYWLAFGACLFVTLTGCASQADRQAQWRTYGEQQCAKLAGADRERCVVDVVARCNSDHEIMGLAQKGCKPT